MLKVALQWFIVYSTLIRGIADLDERALMGHQVLSGGRLAVKPVATMGDNCLDHYLPPLDREFVGGNALNVAIGLRDLGHDVAYAGAIGTDDAGRVVLAAAQARGIDTTHVADLRGRDGRHARSA